MLETIKLNKQELCDFIVQAIGIFKKQTSMFPFRIVKANFTLPDEIEIELQYVPKGTRKKEIEHTLESNTKGETDELSKSS